VPRRELHLDARQRRPEQLGEGRIDTPAVEQHQRRAGAESAQRQRRGAEPGVEDRAAVVEAVGTGGGQPLQEIAQPRGAARVDVLTAIYRDRRRAFQLDLPEVRADDLDAFERHGLSVLGEGVRTGQGQQGGEGEALHGRPHIWRKR
jgi:hypothetical protein